MVLAKKKGVNSRNRIVLDKKKVVSSKIFNSASDTVDVILKEYGFDKKGIKTNENIRFSEEIIAVNQRITVVGNTTFKNLKEPIKRYSYSKIMSLESTKKQPLVITDIIT